MIGWLVVVGAAALLRLSNLDLVEFKYDEARVAGLADALVHRGQIPATSIVTSAGVQNSPLAIYLLAPAALATWRPEVLTGYVGLLNTAAVALTGLMVARYWGARAGLASSLLYAAAPLAVQYSRKVWAPELMPILSVICLWCLVAAFAERRFWLIVPAAAAWSALVQLHQASIWLAPLFAALALAGWRAIRPAPLVPAVAAGLLVAAPYLGYEAQHHWDDLRQLLALAGKPATVSASPWWYGWALATGWGLPSFLGAPDRVLGPRATGRTWLDALQLGSVWCGAAVLAWRACRGPTAPRRPWRAGPRIGAAESPRSGRNSVVGDGAAPARERAHPREGPLAMPSESGRSSPIAGRADPARSVGIARPDPLASPRVAALAVLLWAILPPLGLTRAALPVFPHYLIYWFPAPFVLAGIGIDRLAAVCARGLVGIRGALPAWPFAHSESERSRLPRSILARVSSRAPGRAGASPGAPSDGVDMRPRRDHAGPLSSRAGSSGLLATAIATALLALIVAGDVRRTVLFREAVAARHGGGEYGAPLRDSEAMVARTLAAPEGSRRYVADRGDLPSVYRYVDRAGGAAYVEPDLALVLPPTGRPGVYAYPDASFRGLDVLLRLPGVDGVPASGGYRLVTTSRGWTGALPSGVHPAGFATAAGLDLLGWEGMPTARPGTGYALTLWWRVAQAGRAPPGELKVFTHVLDPQRRTVAQHDALGYAPQFWVTGERVATFFTLQIPATTPAGPYRVVAGLYTLPSFDGVPVTGPNGEALGTEVSLEALTIE